MEQLVKVRRVFDDGTAEVFHVRESACSGDCHKCSGCGAAKETVVFTAVNPLGAKPGDLVTVRSQSAPVLKAAVVLYVAPLVLFFLGVALGSLLGTMEYLLGGFGFCVGIVLVVVYDRKVMTKTDIVYTITEIGKKS